MSATGRKPSTTPDPLQRRLIPERIAAGATLRTVGAEFSLSYETVRRIAAAAGVRSSRKWTPDRLALARQWRSEGVRMNEIAHRLGTTPRAVESALGRWRR